MSQVIQIEGLKELRAKLVSLAPELRDKELRAATAAGAKIVRDAARDLAPVRTGLLRENIIEARRRSAGFDEDYAVAVRSHGKDKPFYWRFVEFGTVKMAAQPFLRPAFENNVQNIINAFKARLTAGLERIARRGR